jgi:hypothetical protein
MKAPPCFTSTLRALKRSAVLPLTKFPLVESYPMHYIAKK